LSQNRSTQTGSTQIFDPLRRCKRAIVLALFAMAPLAALAQDTTGASAVVLVTIDGLRWQEVFAGADTTLLDREAGGVRDVDRLRERFWRDTPEERRQALLPFLWRMIAREGLLLGDDTRPARVANGKNFSYPGYSEILVGFHDDRIDSNAKRPNPNVTVLEWLHRQPGFARSVAVAGSWDVFPYIVNAERSEIPVNAGWQPLGLGRETGAQKMLNRLMMNTTREWQGVRLDSFTSAVALELLARRKPRVLYVALGEPDDWAHDRRYDHYLESTRAADSFLAELWMTLQALPEYRGRTTLLVTTDHGRGSSQRDWTSHGAEVAGSDRIWIAALGPGVSPDTRVEGEITAGRVAATVARAVGADYLAEVPMAAPALWRLE
jgi:hypothetical protein